MRPLPARASALRNRGRPALGDGRSWHIVLRAVFGKAVVAPWCVRQLSPHLAFDGELDKLAADALFVEADPGNQRGKKDIPASVPGSGASGLAGNRRLGMRTA